MNHVTPIHESQDARKPTLRLLPAPVLDYEEYRDRKRIDREDRLDRFEQDCDYRSRSPWP